ncbi:MAG TPA: molybdopterin-dependent oxidoreductase [Bacillota bacterium]|nr:molybdopterin-dependent oxidoreductase [Bacillota bacterium]
MQVRTTCPHDCYDCCGIVAEVVGGKVTSLAGSPTHPVTRGFLCGKVSRYLKRQYSPDRILHPLKRQGSSFRRIGWDEAIDSVAEGLNEAKRTKGPKSVLCYTDAGSMGYLKSLEGRFWEAFGGMTIASGSLCSAAGLAALAADYGQIRQHDPSDIPNSKLLVLWGRNPAVTNIHMVPFIKEAKERGCRVITINPMPSESAALADLAISPAPGSDAALALGMANEIISSGMADIGFIEDRLEGYEAFRDAASEWDLTRTSETTGVPEDDIRQLSRLFATVKPASIWMGFGLQRHSGGGNTVRAINALGAITGNIGRPGAGVNYANRSSRVLAPLSGEGAGQEIRRVWKGTLADELEALGEGEVLAAVIARANPLLQCADSAKMERQFKRIPFKVVLEHFMTDTAQAADIVLPAATFLEEDEIYYSYFHNFISLGTKAVQPSGEARSDLDIFRSLAERMGYGCFEGKDAQDWIEYALQPAAAYGITYEALKQEGWIRFPSPEVPWQDGGFPTPSGRMRIGTPQPPSYVKPYEMPDETYPFYLITGASRDRLHSQYDNLGADADPLPSVYMNPEPALRMGLREDDEVEVFTRQGKMVFRLLFDDRMRKDLLYAHHGRWKSRGGGINRLTRGYLSDMGGQGALYDCVAGIRPLEVS